MGRNDSPQPVPEDLVSVREAAQALGMSVVTIYSWIRQGRVAVYPGPRGWLISVAAAQPHAPPHPATPADAVALYEAIRITGAPRHRIVVWVQQGLLLSWRGPHGRLVRVADVQALAQQRAMATAAAGESTPLPPDALLIREAARRSGLSRDRLYSWIKRGLLPVWLAPGVGQRVRLADVLALAELSRRSLPLTQQREP